MDVYSFDFKLDHIAKHLQLPAAPRLGPAAMELPPEERLPPVLVVNLQLPTYPVSALFLNLNRVFSLATFVTKSMVLTQPCRQLHLLLG